MGALARRGEVFTQGGDPEPPAAIGEDAIAVAPGAGVEDLDVRVIRCGIEAADLGAAQRLVGIALRRHNDAERRLIVPTQIDLVQDAVARREQHRDDIALQPHHQRLTLRVAKADVVFEQFRPVLGQHQPGIEYALERAPVARHRRDCRPDNGFDDFGLDLRRDDRRRREGTHAAGIRAGIAIADPLVVLCGGERQ